MVEWLLGIGGTFLIFFVILDVIWSTLSASGGGPLTNWLGGHLWKWARRVHTRRPNHAVLQIAGVLILLAVVAAWIVLLFTGWFMIFSIEPEVIVNSQTRQPASWADRVYFLGFAIFSLGTGDFVATESIWRVLSVVACATGLFLVTLSITYLVPVITAVTRKRQLAEMISALGSDPIEIVKNGWNGKDFEGIERSLSDLSSTITLIAQRHLAYPVLHFFHSPDISSSVGVSLARLDEAMTIFDKGIECSTRPDERILRNTRHSIEVYIRRVAEAIFDEPEEVPPLPDLDRLRGQGLPLRSLQEVEQAFEERAEHRKMLLTLVHVDGWSWDDGCR